MTALSGALVRAIRMLREHPEISDVQPPAIDRSLVRIDLVARVPLPSRLVGLGPFGIRREEPVTLELPIGYPIGTPRFLLRQDFDARHPHLQPMAAGGRPEPCLLLGSVEELVLARGGVTPLIDQLGLWFQRAVDGALIDSRHGWEPRRRDRIDGFVVLDEPAVRALAGRGCRGGSRWYGARVRLPPARAPGLPRVDLDLDARLSVPEAIDAVVSAPIMPDRRVIPGIALVAWAGKTPSGAPHVNAEYAPESVTTMAQLRDCAEQHGCAAELAGALNRLGRQLDGVILPQPFLLSVLLLVRRPLPLVGTDSTVEISAYTYVVMCASDLRRDASRPMCALGHRDRLTPELLARLSHKDRPYRRPVWGLIGCGSLGSKMAVHAAREGRGPTVVIDSRPLEPHNMARHALLPTATPDGSVGPVWKAESLASALDLLAQPCRACPMDARRLDAGPTRPERAIGGPVAYLVNTTASVGVREALVRLRWHGRRPVTVEACLYGAGRVGYLAREGIDAGTGTANPTTSDLAGEFYQHLRSRPEIARVVHGVDEQRVMLGQGCSSATFVMPDAQLSALAAPLTTALLECLEADLPVPDRGQLLLGSTDADRLDQRWERIEVAPRMIVREADAQGIEVRLAPRLLEAVREDIEAHPGVETGGWLIGRFSDAGNHFQILDTMPATEGSERRADRFVMAAADLSAEHEGLARATGGTLRIIGTWHNHLVDSGPSSTDHATAKRLAQSGLPGPNLLLIVTPTRFRFVVADGVPEVVGLAAASASADSGSALRADSPSESDH